MDAITGKPVAAVDVTFADSVPPSKDGRAGMRTPAHRRWGGFPFTFSVASAGRRIVSLRQDVDEIAITGEHPVRLARSSPCNCEAINDVDIGHWDRTLPRFCPEDPLFTAEIRLFCKT